MKKEEEFTYITFKVPDGFVQIPLPKISHFLIIDSKTKMFYKNGEYKIISENIKSLEANLQEYGFIRIHQNCVINIRQELNFCVKNRTIVLSNKCNVTVAKDRLLAVKDILINTRK